MVESCCVVGCTVRRNKRSKCLGVGLYRIPADINERRAWIKAISRKNWKPRSWDKIVVCGRHFVCGRPSHTIGDVDYFPTLYMKGQSVIMPLNESVSAHVNKCRRANRTAKRSEKSHASDVCEVSLFILRS